MIRNPTRPPLTDAERILLGYLHRHCRGRGRAMPYRRLRRELAFLGTEIGARDMYKIVRSIALKGRPIGTTSRRDQAGAFVWNEGRDTDLAVQNLRGRLLKQLVRLRVTKRAAAEFLAGQLYLDLQEAEAAYEAALEKAESLPGLTPATKEG